MTNTKKTTVVVKTEEIKRKEEAKKRRYTDFFEMMRNCTDTLITWDNMKIIESVKDCLLEILQEVKDEWQDESKQYILNQLSQPEYYESATGVISGSWSCNCFKAGEDMNKNQNLYGEALEAYGYDGITLMWSMHNTNLNLLTIEQAETITRRYIYDKILYNMDFNDINELIAKLSF